jgi:hypothetical protein
LEPPKPTLSTPLCLLYLFFHHPLVTFSIFGTSISIFKAQHQFHVEVQRSLYRPGQALRVPEYCGSKYQDSRHMKAVLNPQQIFLLENQSTPGPQNSRKNYVNKKFQWHHRESNPRPSGFWSNASTAQPQAPFNLRERYNFLIPEISLTTTRRNVTFRVNFIDRPN